MGNLKNQGQVPSRKAHPSKSIFIYLFLQYDKVQAENMKLDVVCQGTQVVTCCILMGTVPIFSS